MEEVTPKEKILKKIRQALMYKSKNNYPDIDLESNVYNIPEQDPAVLFASRFTDQSGEFVFCDNHFDCIDNLISLIEVRKWNRIFCWEPALLEKFKDTGLQFEENKDQFDKVEAGITSCEALIARTGSVVLSSKQNSRTLSAYSPVHIVIAYTSQLVPDVKDSFTFLKNKYGNNMPSMITLETGPSKTAAFDSKIVRGGLGPMELFLFLIDDTSNR